MGVKSVNIRRVMAFSIPSKNKTSKAMRFIGILQCIFNPLMMRGTRACWLSAEKAESSGKLSFIAKYNGMRRTAREKEEQVKSLEQEIEKKLQDVKSSL